MYSLKGFMSYGNLHDNAVGVIAPLGELSTNALTYAKEKGYYNIPTAKDSAFVSFYSYDHTQSKLIPVPVHFKDTILAIGQWLYEQSTSGQLQSTETEVYMGLSADFPDTLGEFEVGPMVSDGSNWLPQWIQFKLLSDTQFDDNLIKIWFSNEAFETQYDEYEIEFIAPIERLDDFFKNALQVKALVESRSLTDLMYKVEQVKEKNPYTYLQSNMYEYHDVLDFDWTLPTNWMVMLYGIAGNNVDIIKRELQEWILGQSTYPREEWKKVFPDIFTNTEFIITPLWDQYSVPNRTIQAGVHSPTTEYHRIAKVAKKTCVGDGYTETHIIDHTAISSCMYKSLQFLSCGGPDNRGGVSKFYDQFTDYMAVSSSSNDFNRMSLKTQNWILFLNELLIVAENMTDHSVIPVGFSRLYRNGIMYIVGTYDDIQYLVVSRKTMEETAF